MDSGDDTTFAFEASSKSKLIEFQHVGVTAKIQSPMKLALPECSSAETETIAELFHNNTYKSHKSSNTPKYNKFNCDDSETTTMTMPSTATATTTEESKLLYEMHAERQCGSAAAQQKPRNRNTFSRIEFQLYNKPTKRLKPSKHRHCTTKKRCNFAKQRSQQQQGTRGPSLFQRLRESLERMCAAKAPIVGTKSPTLSLKQRTPLVRGVTPLTQMHQRAAGGVGVGGGDIHGINTDMDMDMEMGMGMALGSGFYPFEHGCASYLRTTDYPPQILSNVLDEHATYYATRFWAEFFGSLHIAISFVVTFVLQSYRFVLYSLVNTLLVGVLQMTSDYLLKPVLTVIFNGFLQPPLIFVYNILATFRDLFEPISDTFNNFMKPLATVGRSLRLVHINQKKFVKDV